jgi:uncharacterized protein
MDPHTTAAPSYAPRAAAAWGPLAATAATVAVAVIAMGLSLLPVFVGGRTGVGFSISSNQLIISIAISQLAMGLGGWWLAGLRGGDRADILAWQPLGISVGMSVLAVLGMIAVTSCYQAFLGHDIFADLMAMAPLFKTPLWPLTFVLVSLGAPIAEEILFRGFLQTAFSRSRAGFWAGVVVATLIWTALHMQYQLPGLLLVALMGIMFSLMLRATGSLRLPLIAHAVNNTIASVYLLYLIWI